MEVDRATVDAELGFTMTILPLADIHMESARRKSKAKKGWRLPGVRVGKIWWET